MHPRRAMMKRMMWGPHPLHEGCDCNCRDMRRMKSWLLRDRPSRVQFKEEDDAVIVHVAAPGLDKDTVEIKAKENLIRITAEYQDEFKEFGPEFFMQFEVPLDVDPHSGKAKYRDGMIILAFKRTSPPTKIEVQLRKM